MFAVGLASANSPYFASSDITLSKAGETQLNGDVCVALSQTRVLVISKANQSISARIVDNNVIGKTVALFPVNSSAISAAFLSRNRVVMAFIVNGVYHAVLLNIMDYEVYVGVLFTGSSNNSSMAITAIGMQRAVLVLGSEKIKTVVLNIDAGNKVTAGPEVETNFVGTGIDVDMLDSRHCVMTYSVQSNGKWASLLTIVDMEISMSTPIQVISVSSPNNTTVVGLTASKALVTDGAYANIMNIGEVLGINTSQIPINPGVVIQVNPYSITKINATTVVFAYLYESGINTVCGARVLDIVENKLLIGEEFIASDLLPPGSAMCSNFDGRIFAVYSGLSAILTIEN